MRLQSRKAVGLSEDVLAQASHGRFDLGRIVLRGLALLDVGAGYPEQLQEGDP